jgi:[ribosomal protein S5]-alanine N-acetyltransferase
MNECPPPRGKSVLLRKPVRRDIEGRLRCGRDRDIAHGYGGDTRNMVPVTGEDAVACSQEALSAQCFSG